MCPDLLHWPQLPMTHPAACWLHMSVCVLAVFIGVCRLPGSLQVSVSIIQRAEWREPAELWLFSLWFCVRLNVVSQSSAEWSVISLFLCEDAFWWVIATQTKNESNKYLTNNAFLNFTLLSVRLHPRYLPETLMPPQPRRIFSIWHMYQETRHSRFNMQPDYVFWGIYRSLTANVS